MIDLLMQYFLMYVSLSFSAHLFSYLSNRVFIFSHRFNTLSQHIALRLHVSGDKKRHFLSVSHSSRSVYLYFHSIQSRGLGFRCDGSETGLLITIVICSFSRTSSNLSLDCRYHHPILALPDPSLFLPCVTWS